MTSRSVAVCRAPTKMPPPAPAAVSCPFPLTVDRVIVAVLGVEAPARSIPSPPPEVLAEIVLPVIVSGSGTPLLLRGWNQIPPLSPLIPPGMVVLSWT